MPQGIEAMGAKGTIKFIGIDVAMSNEPQA